MSGAILTTNEFTTVQPPEMLVVDNSLMLQRMRAANAAATFALMHASKDSIDKFMPGMLDPDEETMRQTLTSVEAGMAAGRIAFYDIFDQGAYVGAVNLHSRHHENSLEIASLGYWKSDVAPKTGSVTRSAERLIDFGLRDFGLDAIWIDIDPANSRSIAVAERLGATSLGETTAGEGSNSLAEVHYQITEEDWTERHA